MVSAIQKGWSSIKNTFFIADFGLLGLKWRRRFQAKKVPFFRIADFMKRFIFLVTFQMVNVASLKSFNWVGGSKAIVSEGWGILNARGGS